MKLTYNTKPYVRSGKVLLCDLHDYEYFIYEHMLSYGDPSEYVYYKKGNSLWCKYLIRPEDHRQPEFKVRDNWPYYGSRHGHCIVIPQ